MLIQIEGENYVNPQDVKAVIVQNTKVVVFISCGSITVSTDSPETLRDKLAEQINTACAWAARGERP